ncbi:MAG: ribonuclease P protein component [Actinomycetota bacterium]
MRNPPSLRSGRDFQRVLAEGGRARRDGILAVVVPSDQPESPPRLGLAVHCNRGAVARNRAKRRLRAAFRALDLQPGYDVVLRADERVLLAGYGDLVDDLRAALTEAIGNPR